MATVFIADLHVSRYHAKNAILRQRLEQLRIQHPMDNLCLLGDITDDGYSGQYLQAIELLKPWKNQLLLCEGNHDFGKLGLLLDQECYAQWNLFADILGAKTEAISNGWRIVCLNSVRSDGDGAILAQGSCGETELERARVAIETGHRDGLKVCVALHHDVETTDFGMQLLDRDSLMAVTVDADMLIGGHSHRHSYSTRPGRKGCILGLKDFRAELLDIYRL